jgi:hypothetical protein
MACLMPRKHQFDFWKCTPFILAACIIYSPAWTQQAEKKSSEDSKIEIVASAWLQQPRGVIHGGNGSLVAITTHWRHGSERGDGESAP